MLKPCHNAMIYATPPFKLHFQKKKREKICINNALASRKKPPLFAPSHRCFFKSLTTNLCSTLNNPPMPMINGNN